MLTTRVLPSDGRAYVAGIDVVAQPHCHQHAVLGLGG
jgi:hypothetical protein